MIDLPAALALFGLLRIILPLLSVVLRNVQR